jgi:hypothetical protein
MSDDMDKDYQLDVFQTYGKTGLKQYGGHIYEEFLNDLKGNKAARVYREMSDNDAVVGSIMYAIQTLVRSVDWRVEPANDEDGARAAAEFIEECLFEDMERTWTDTLSEILSFLVYGFSVHEVVYKLRQGPDNKHRNRRSKFKDNRIGWRGFPIRSQETINEWEINDEGDICGLYQLSPPDWATRYIPSDKFLLFRTSIHKNNPEGRSILRNAYKSYYYKSKIQTYEAIGISRDLAGLPTLEVPLQMLSSNASASEKATLASMKDMIQRVGRDEYEGLVIPSEQNSDGTPTGFRLRLLSSGGRRPIDVNEIIKRYESRIAMTVLGEFVLLGMDSVGSFALSNNKTALFAQALATYLDNIASLFNNQAIPQLLRLNGVPEGYFPTLVYEDVEAPELNEFSSSLSTLVGSGLVTPDDALEDYVREYANLPKVESDTARELATPETEAVEQLADELIEAEEADESQS